MDEFEQIYGTIRNVIYLNEENGYSILTVRDWNDNDITVVGCIPDPAPGEQIEASGKWVEHQSYGKQFKAEMFDRFLPRQKDDICAYLSSGIIKGMGPATANLIVGKFGEKSLDVLLDEPEKLATIKGISNKKALEFTAIFREKHQLRRNLDYFTGHGLSPLIAIKMDSIYKSDAIEVVENNPYIIAEPKIGGTFTDADRLAAALGTDPEDKNRIRAAVIYELRYNLNNGHCFIPRESLIGATSKMIDVDYDLCEEAVDKLIDSFYVITEVINGITACYLPRLYEAETYVAEKLVSMKDRVTIITGGPGTGKTTRICRYVEEFEKTGQRYYLVAPTGRAAKRMSEVTKRDAATIHRLLGARFADDGNGVVFTKCENDLLVCDAVILDECSMVDILVLDALLRAVPDKCRLILVGDADQLPPVGPGNVFRALISSEAFETITLTEIYRQNENSDIIKNAYLINKGNYPNFGDNSRDFFRLKRSDEAEAVKTICELCAKRLPEKMGIPSEDIQVLTPTKKGELGTRNLNKYLQSAVNPPSKEKKERTYGETIFREGDRIMQVRNNYDTVWHNKDYSVTGNGIYNGDIGYIIKVDNDDEFVECDFDGKICRYGSSSMMEIEHAWAITVHKSQGSEYKAVILALSKSSKMLLTRGILYTAVTRARNILVMIGEDDTANKMIDNSKRAKRYTFLRYRIKTLCGLI